MDQTLQFLIRQYVASPTDEHAHQVAAATRRSLGEPDKRFSQMIQLAREILTEYEREGYYDHLDNVIYLEERATKLSQLVLQMLAGEYQNVEISNRKNPMTSTGSLDPVNKAFDIWSSFFISLTGSKTVYSSHIKMLKDTISLDILNRIRPIFQP